MKLKFFLFFFLLLMPFSFVKATGLELGNNINEAVALSYDYVEKDEHGVEFSTKPMEVVITSPVIKLEEENPNTLDDIEYYFVFNIIMTVGLIYSVYYLKRISN